MTKFVLSPLSLLTLLFLLRTSALAQATNDEKVAQLQSDIALLKLQNDKLEQQLKGEQTRAAAAAAVATSAATKAQQEAAAFKAAFPTDKVTPLSGNLTADKDYTLPPHVLTYSASEEMLSQVASSITGILRARTAKSRAPARILIYQTSDSLAGQRAAYTQLMSRIKSINETLQKSENDFLSLRRSIQNLPPGKPAATDALERAKDELSGTRTKSLAAGLAGVQSLNEGITAVNSTLQSVIQLISLFRTDTSITGLSITLDADALAAQLGHLLQATDFAPTVEYPALLVNDDSLVLKAIGDMKQKQGIVAPRRADLESMTNSLTTRQKVIEEQIKQQLPLGSPPSDENARIVALATKISIDEYQMNVNRLTDVRDRIAGLDVIATKLDNALQTPDEKSGAMALSGIVKTEALVVRLQQPNTYSVILKTVMGGGATKIDKNLFTGTKISHLGGAIFVTTVTDSRGGILFTNVSKGFLGYAKLHTTGGTIEQDLEPAPGSRRPVRH